MTDNRVPPPDVVELGRLLGEAGRTIRRHRGTAVRYRKDDGTPVSSADYASEQLFMEALPRIKAGPVLSEESFDSTTPRTVTDRYWLVDPLDGTASYLDGSDEYAIVAAFLVGDQPILGGIAAPEQDVAYVAMRGGGAFRIAPNGVSQVMKRSSGDEVLPIRSMVTTRFPSAAGRAANARLAEMLGVPAARCEGVASQLKTVALIEGRTDVVASYDPVSWWDLGGAAVLAEELDLVILQWRTGDPIRFRPREGPTAGGYVIAFRSAVPSVRRALVGSQL